MKEKNMKGNPMKTSRSTAEVSADFSVPVVLTDDIMAQIYFLNSHSPRDVEWSGLLIYKLTKGSISKPREMEIEAVGIYPMDYGSQTFTSFEGGEDWIKCFEQYPQVSPFKPTPGWYIGKIHSHNRMGVFHSGTDMADLHENTPKLPMFLSLIVNYACEAHCLLAVETEIKITTTTSWRLKLAKKFITQTEVTNPTKLLLITCNVQVSVDEWFYDQCEVLSKSKPAYVDKGVWNKIDKPERFIKQTYEPDNNTEVGIKLNLHVVDTVIYSVVLQQFGDLISLGTSSLPSTAYVTLRQVSMDLDIQDLGKYREALTKYFAIWYRTHFFIQAVRGCTVIKVNESLQRFLSFHLQIWLVPHLQKVFNKICYPLKQLEGNEAHRAETSI